MKHLSVLIVDDDSDEKEMFCEAIGEINHSIECGWAKNASEALATLERSSSFPDFIFLDLNMPGLSGKQCLAKIKSNEPWAHIPVYIYSTSKLESDKRETIKMGAAGYITKPSTYRELKQSLLSILENTGKPE